MTYSSIVVVHCHPLDTSFSAALFEAVVGELGDKASYFSLYQDEEPSTAELEAATTLILVYPTWWSGLPGRLLDWYQRTFGPSIDGQASAESSPIRNLDRLVAVTTHGSPKFLNRLQGEPGKRMLAQCVDKCTSAASFDWVALYEIDTTSAGDRSEFISRATVAVRQPGARNE